MKIGLYFGTFNPIHIGHIIIANHMAEFSDLDQIWMVITPHNPHKKKMTLLNSQHRLQMVFLATENFPKIVPSDIEFKLTQPNYTINTLSYLEEKFPQNTFSLIMGEDNLKTFHKWKNYKIILKNYDIYVYPRISSKKYLNSEDQGFIFTFSGNFSSLMDIANNRINPDLVNHPRIHLVDAPIVEISSTFIRESIRQGKNIEPLLTPKVWAYIDHNLFYKK